MDPIITDVIRQEPGFGQAMKNQIIDKFLKSGRLQGRLSEILDQVAAKELPRMDAGDLVGQQIVANLEALPNRSPDEQRLLFDAQVARATLYHESSGATVLEAAESLIAARRTLMELDDQDDALHLLFEPANQILDELVDIGSRRNAWQCLEILVAALKASKDQVEAIPPVMHKFVEISRALIEEGRDPGILPALLCHCRWVREVVPDEFREMVNLIPFLLERRVKELRTADVLSAYLYARHLSIGFRPETLRKIVDVLAIKERIDAEARVVFQDYLLSAGESRAEMESVFEELAYVNPGSDLAYDADLDSLNVLLSDFYSEHVWVWRNRGLLLRRRDDATGALVCLARALNISGKPPEIMGILSPLVAELGFIRSARQFAHFSDKFNCQRFRLDILKLFVAVPGSRKGGRILRAKLAEVQRSADLPKEFRLLVRAREADLLYSLGENEAATDVYTSIFHSDLSDEFAATRLAHLAFLNGDIRRCENYLAAQFSARVVPLVEHVRSLVCEQDDDLTGAWQHNEAALQSMEEAQSAGRFVMEKNILMLEDRIRSSFGEEFVNCAFIAMLQVETYAPRHRDLDDLLPILEKRSVELGMKRGDVAGTSERIKKLVAEDHADTGVFLTGIRASLEAGRIEEASELIVQAESHGHALSGEMGLLRGLVALREGEFDKAEEQLEEAMDRVPTAEARLALATIALESGDEKKALTLLEGLREDEGGSDELRHRILGLRALLLERAGRGDEARMCYMAATSLNHGFNEARHRAGILSIKAATDAEFVAIDPTNLEIGIDLLKGFNDSESVAHVAMARAANESSEERALDVLECALKRCTGAHWSAVARKRLQILLHQENWESAIQATDKILAEEQEQDEGLVRNRQLLWSRSALMALRDAPSLDLSAVRRILTQFGDQESCLEVASVLNILSILVNSEAREPELNRNSKVSLRLAAGILGALRRKDGKMRSSLAAAVEAPGTEVEGIASTLLQGFDGGQAADLIAAVDACDTAEYTLPWARLDILSVAAAKAVQEQDEEVLQTVQGRAPARFPEHALFQELSACLESPQSDSVRVLHLVSDLSRALADRPGCDAKRQYKTVRACITNLRETPSPAWAASRLRIAGKRTRAWDAVAIEFWESQRRDDVHGEALHQLALMKLARAHERETTDGNCAEEWKEVHQLWYELVRHDGFWMRLFGDCGGLAAIEEVDAVRERLAGWLLQAQLSVAKRRIFANDVSRAVEQGRIVAASPLIALTSANLVRDELFVALSGDLEKLLSKKRFAESLACIDHVIVADPGNPMARCEMVRVAAQAISPTFALLDAFTNAEESTTLTDTCNVLSEVHLIAERSIRELMEEEIVDNDLAQALALCLRSLAFVSQHRKADPEDAGRLIERAIGVLDNTGSDSKAYRRIRTAIGLRFVEKTMTRPTTTEFEVGGDCGDPLTKALEEMDRLTDLDPDNAEIVVEKTRLLLVANRDAEAESLARSLFQSAQEKREPLRVRTAVELLHQVQLGREKLRYDGAMDMVDRLVKQQNWRAALQIFKDATVGAEQEPNHLLKNIDILLGMRKLDRAELLLEQLRDCEDKAEACTLRRARLALVRHMSTAGGDQLSAFELIERDQYEKALVILDELLNVNDKDPVLQYLVGYSTSKTGNIERTQAHLKAAQRCAKSRELHWVKVLVDAENNK